MHSRLLFIALGLVPLLTLAARADVHLPAIFGNHMVLQQNIKLPVWGKADAGEEVTVSIGKNEGKATADASGNWMVKLDPLPVSSTPVELKVAGKNTITFSDVLVGDVWLCSGQSNMEFGLGNAQNAKDAIPQMNYPAIRMFIVPHTIAFDPQFDIQQDNIDIPPDASAPAKMRGHWVVCTPENVINIGGWNGFSAIAMFCARELFEKRHEPLGMIGAYWGGTPIKDWMSLDLLQSDPAWSQLVTDFNTTKTNWQTMLADYKTTTVPKWQTDHDAWKQQVAALAPGQPKPKEPKKPDPPDAYPQQPAILFDGMINPLVPYALKGVFWCQGESDGNLPEDKHGGYAKLFPAMITDWRKRWGQGDFPFLYVQCSSWGFGYFSIAVRNAQLETLSLPKTGMVVTMDLGAEWDPHYKDKIDVGRRLALVARHVAYGEDIVYSGPLYASSTMEGDKIRVTFTNTGSGLVIGTPPADFYPPGQSAPPPSDQLTGFEIAGSDYIPKPAQAKIDGNTVLIWSDAVPKPKFARFGWAGFPKPLLNLYNKEGLPASPFSTKETIYPTTTTAAVP